MRKSEAPTTSTRSQPIAENPPPDGLVSSLEYDGEGNKSSETDRRGVKTNFGYDNLGRLRRTEVEPSITGVASISQVIYDDVENERTEIEPGGIRRCSRWMRSSGWSRSPILMAHTQSFIYDGVNKIEEIDKREHSTHFEYDRLNRLRKVTDALEREYMTDYLDSARQVVETDKRGIVKTTQLDSLGRLISVNRAGVTLEQHEYDANSNRSSPIDGEGNKTRFGTMALTG